MLGLSSWRVRFARRHLTAGDLARDSGQWEIAAYRYACWLRFAPNDHAIWVQLGHSLREQGRFPEAETAYRQAVEADPSSGDAHLQLGCILSRLRVSGEAELCFKRALETEMEECSDIQMARFRATVYACLGDLARDQRKWADAAEYYQSALSVEVSNAPLWVQFGHTLKEQSLWERSVAAYSRGVEIGLPAGDADDAYKHLTSAYRQLHNQSLAKQAILQECLSETRRELDGSRQTESELRLALAQVSEQRDAARRTEAELRQSLYQLSEQRDAARLAEEALTTRLATADAARKEAEAAHQEIVASMERKQSSLQATLERSLTLCEELKVELALAKQTESAISTELSMLQSTVSWRVTRPFRYMWNSWRSSQERMLDPQSSSAKTRSVELGRIR